MATTPTAATPSPSSHIRTPPTPRLGFADSWEPFSPRKSSRLANAKSAAAASSSSSTTSARTPSPSSATRRAARLLRSPRQTKQSLPAPTQPPAAQHSTFSPAPTPRKKRTMPATHFFSPEDTHKSKLMAAAANGEGSSQMGMGMGMGMLPTPAKTPSKKVHAASQNESNIAAIARNLFHTDVDQVMASPSKTPSRKAKKYTGVSLESFAVVEEEDPISIFTDSQDRVPEADSSVDNPFFGGGAATAPSAPEPSRRRSKRNHVSIPGEGKQTVDDATRREDGLVYVFRGKKIFRKFDESSASQEEEDVLDSASAGKRLTRSAIKPRLLFPRSTHSVPQAENVPEDLSEDDEEADTDIEDHNLDDADVDDLAEAEAEAAEAEAESDVVSTPTGHAGKAAAPNTPPNAPRFAPDSPPVTVRTTRSGHRAAAAEETTPVKPTVAKKRSPFDGWRQTKSTGSAAGHKRQADELGTPIPTAASKRSRF